MRTLLSNNWRYLALNLFVFMLLLMQFVYQMEDLYIFIQYNNYNTNNLGFVSWIVNCFKNCFVFLLASLCWISLMVWIEYHINLLFVFKNSQNLIQIHYYQPKHVALSSIKNLLIIVIIVLISKTIANKDGFQCNVLLGMYVFITSYYLFLKYR